MEFVKTHWSRLLIALLFLIGGALAIVYYIDEFAIVADATADPADKLFVFLPFISAIIYFFGMLAIMVLKTCGAKGFGFIYTIVGALVTIFNLVVICVAGIAMNAAVYWAIIVPLIVFGLYPLLKGITKFVESGYAGKPAPVEAPKK